MITRLLYYIIYIIYIIIYVLWIIQIITYGSTQNLISPPIPSPRWESTPVAGEGKGKGKKVLLERLAVCSEKYRVDGPGSESSQI